ncbi:MAG: ribonuclease P protein component [Phycisphaerae bacterium]|nr:ribonuclease P protein component [Phycisphaerae bacterium]
MIPVRFSFPRSLRITKKKDFDAVYAHTMCRRTSALMFHAKPNGLAISRIGLSIPKRVGTAPTRNTLKRQFREAFRLIQHDVPSGYDLVVTMHKHENLSLESIEKLLHAVLQEYDDQCKNK